LDALHHAERLVPADQQAAAWVQLLQHEVAHGRVRLVDQHVLSARVEVASDNCVDIPGEKVAAALPLRGAGTHVLWPGDPGGALHVG